MRQCNMGDDVKKAKATKKRSVGRPKIHTEEMVPVLVRIPRSVVAKIDKLGISRQMVVLAAIYKEVERWQMTRMRGR